MTVRLKPTVQINKLAPQLYFALGIADQAYADEDEDCIVTAAQDGQHNPNSLHPKGLAVDIRSNNLNTEQHDRILLKLQRLERYGFDVVDEGAHATAATTAIHFHIEYDPKGVVFWKVAS